VCNVCGAFDAAFAKLLWLLVKCSRGVIMSSENIVLLVGSPQSGASHSNGPRCRYVRPCVRHTRISPKLSEIDV